MARPIRILHCLGALDPGGIETWLVHLVKSLDTTRFQFDFCTFGTHAGLYATEVEKFGSKVHRCPQSQILWKMGRNFRQILRDGQYDVVHSHVFLFSGVILRWARLAGVQVRVAHSHGSHDESFDKPLRRYYRALMQHWIYSNCTHGLAASQIAADELFQKRWRQDKRFRVLHYGIDLVPFQSSFDNRILRQEMGIPVDAAVIGHVGRFVESKNHKFLLQVAREVLKLRPDIHFLLVGDGPIRTEIERRARVMGLSPNVHFTGTRTDIPQLMRGCMDAFIFPSLWEGLPVAVTEAQAAGLPCVLSDTVSDETTILQKRMFYLPLSKGPAEWARATVESLNLGRLTADSVMDALAESDFDIRRSAHLVADLYTNATQSIVIQSRTIASVANREKIIRNLN